MLHWQFPIIYIFSISLKFGACYITGHFFSFKKNGFLLFSWLFEWNFKFPQQNINHSKTGTGDKKLSEELYFKMNWGSRTIKPWITVIIVPCTINPQIITPWTISPATIPTYDDCSLKTTPRHLPTSITAPRQLLLSIRTTPTYNYSNDILELFNILVESPSTKSANISESSLLDHRNFPNDLRFRNIKELQNFNKTKKLYEVLNYSLNPYRTEFILLKY